MAEVPPQNRRTISTSMLAVEILPPLTEIISPVFRPVRMLTVSYLYSIRQMNLPDQCTFQVAWTLLSSVGEHPVVHSKGEAAAG